MPRVRGTSRRRKAIHPQKLPPKASWSHRYSREVTVTLRSAGPGISVPASLKVSIGTGAGGLQVALAVDISHENAPI
ncbi:hypothetical protein BOTBODRAFT_27130 [Botryobasidium botryosum FD-172 SS1]|uniref:Uncharacterized protein n=1 Tax=Botryobasidium botryosum (strain FD-172 SS1) TaxID=930990 RepID=A0A067MVD6_BOTB1|nr:hypothetical protein BOTBODRAFT_27130 [Botryobasidium botryosum FD-172 SS1]